MRRLVCRFRSLQSGGKPGSRKRKRRGSWRHRHVSMKNAPDAPRGHRGERLWSMNSQCTVLITQLQVTRVFAGSKHKLVNGHPGTFDSLTLVAAHRRLSSSQRPRSRAMHGVWSSTVPPPRLEPVPESRGSTPIAYRRKQVRCTWCVVTL